jgi:undecaprenyl diphosphate synthase
MHVAIIMDGNGRWAVARGLPLPGSRRRKGVAPSRRRRAPGFAAHAACVLGGELAAAGRRVKHCARCFSATCYANTARPQQSIINVIGRRRLPGPAASDQAAGGDLDYAHDLRIAVDYSAQHSLMTASRCRNALRGPRGVRARAWLKNDHSLVPTPDVVCDSHRRRKRLSDFLLWECAYAELLFLDCMWPDRQRAFADALDGFSGRQRRFGKIDAVAVVEAARLTFAGRAPRCMRRPT